MEPCKCGALAESDQEGVPYLVQGKPSWETQMILEGEALEAQQQLSYEDTQYERRW